MKILFSYILIIFYSFKFEGANAQEKIMEGRTTFTFSYPDEKGLSEQFLSRREIKGRTVYFKNGKTRTECEDSNKSTYLIYPKEQERILLKEKLALKHTFKEDHESEAWYYGDSIARISNETKMIAGFMCVKALFTYPVRQKQRTIEIWFTKDIAASNDNFSFSGIDGFIMEYTWTDVAYQGEEGVDFRETMTCTRVEKITVPDELLKIPADYTVMTWDEFKKGAKVEYH
jgi:GLPGLI family protein